MTTVTGTIEAPNDAPLHVLVTFALQASPLFLASGKVVLASPVLVKTNPSDGTFSVSLEAGVYQVSFSNFYGSTYYIAVPATGGPFTIDQLVTPPTVFSYTTTCSGNPNGQVPALPGYFCTDTVNGTIYVKLAGTGTSGWQAILQL